MKVKLGGSLFGDASLNAIPRTGEYIVVEGTVQHRVDQVIWYLSASPPYVFLVTTQTVKR